MPAKHHSNSHDLFMVASIPNENRPVKGRVENESGLAKPGALKTRASDASVGEQDLLRPNDLENGKEHASEYRVD